ncbi:unnamed protein product [Larinioides sclopetarius]|uniref:Tyrosyl-DNA phosphodiesterase 2 n=1 Tax=Larinioides sclopetarius TaxID=280406 RepID=A0AAV2A900_9ARAC
MSSNDRADSEDGSEIATSTEKLNSDTKSVLKFITWNVDGLDEEDLIPRTDAVCKTILNEQADIVFLQEVVPESAEYFREHLPEYQCLFGNEDGYFIGTLLNKCTVCYKGSQIIDFPTMMGRNCLKVNVVFQDKNLLLFNSHLESTRRGTNARKMQLRKIFKEVLVSPNDTTAIFAGDLNSRDKELIQLGGLPAGIEDLWISFGSKKECEYTFDLAQNDNLVMDVEVQPRCRFDRIYVRHSSPRQFKPTYFGLIGLERLSLEECFPSDHWGILSHFEVE